MSDQITEIVIPILRGLQSDLSSVKTDVSMLKKAVQRLDGHIASMDSHLAGFHQLLRTHNEEHDDHRGRIEALEEAAKDLKSDEPKP